MQATKFKEFMEFLSTLKKISESKQFHNTKDLENIITIHHKLFNQTVNSMALYPFIEGVDSTLKNLNALQNGLNQTDYLQKQYPKQPFMHFGGNILIINICSYNFSFAIQNKEITQIKELVDSSIKKLENFLHIYKVMEQKIKEHINIEVLPDATLNEIVYFNMGKIIIPSNQDWHVFRFELSKDSQKEPLQIYQESKYPLKSLEGAMERYIDHNVLQSVVIAKNTETYPLYETSLPIIKEKYFNQAISH